MNFLANPVFGVSGCVHAKLLLPCPILCDPVDCSPLGSSVQGFSRPEYWSGLPRPPPGDFLNPGSNPCLISPALASSFFTASATWIQGFEEPSICWRERTSDLPIRACFSEGTKGKVGRLCAWSASDLPSGVSSLSVATLLGYKLSSTSPGLAYSRCSGKAYGAYGESVLHVSCLETWLRLTSLDRCPCFCCFIKGFICDQMTDSSFRKREELVWTIVKLPFNSKKTGPWQL